MARKQTRPSSANGSGDGPATVRVAIYCRQSVDRGDEFSSIEAQREAIEAHIKGQQGAGWHALPEEYNDCGYSGSTVNRPAFQRLLHDVEAGKVDAVAVYKFDRLARNQIDFLKTVYAFEERDVGFVSTTQSLDTSTSMGRCMLGMMSAFAQLERDCISERTKDKMQASRRRGLSTGGRPILGFDLIDKQLVVNASEADQVKAIFQLYLEHASLLSVVDELRRRGWTAKSWVNKKGKRVRGRPFDKSSLHGLLKNALYMGKVRAGDQLYKGEHEAIVDEATWHAVDEQLRANGTGRGPMRSARSNKNGALLKGIARCVCGSALAYTQTRRGNRTWGYYCCGRHSKEGAASCPNSRVAVGELDAAVLEQVRAVGRDPKVLDATVAADKADREARKPELIADLRRLTGERQRLQNERENFLAAIATGGTAAPLLASRLAEIDEKHAETEARLSAVQGELAALERGGVDLGELRAALLNLEPLWDELFPRERSRLLSLLLEEVVFDAATGEAEVCFRKDGPRALRHGGAR